MNVRTVKRKPRLSNVSRSTLSTASSATITDPIANGHSGILPVKAAGGSKPLPPPPKSLLFTFHQHSFNTMVAYADSTVHYHVTVCMNCFIPSSFITIIRREHEKGDFVSSFEMGISTQRATVNMYGKECAMDTVLSRTGRKTDDRIWQWKWDSEPGHILGWHRDTPVRYCYLLDHTGRPSGPTVAAFAVSGAQEGAPQPASLKVYPDGEHIVDHIFTSALIVERKRLTPSPMTVNPIFN